MKVSVIVTVKNEGAAIQILLDSLCHQTLAPDEVVVCDGGSTDNTLAVVSEFERWLPIRIVEAPGSNISEGRNRAIAAATGPVIAATDAGVSLSPIWLASITEAIRRGEASVVSGWFEPDPYTDFEVVMGATVLPELSDIDQERFLPSSRSIAFLKSAWEKVGGYPEWLDYCEDLVFDFALREQYGAIPFEPRAVAYFRPRGTLRSYYKQYYRYARGDGKAGLWFKRHVIRYGVYLVALPALLRLIWRGSRLGWGGLLLGGGAYCLRPAQRLWPLTRGWRLWPRLRVFGLMPIIRLVGDIAKMIGYPVGVVWRLRHRGSE